MGEFLGANTRENHSVSPMDRVGSGEGVRGWKRMARGLADSRPERLAVSLPEATVELAPVVERPQNLNVDSELLTDSRLKGPSPSMQEVSICSSSPLEAQFFGSAQGHESNSSSGVIDLAVAAR